MVFPSSVYIVVVFNIKYYAGIPMGLPSLECTVVTAEVIKTTCIILYSCSISLRHRALGYRPSLHLYHTSDSAVLENSSELIILA